MREKVDIHRAQLDDVVNENSILHLALQELQQEMQNMTRQLRGAVPAAEVMSPDLESVLSRMENVMRQGGGAYVRLHKEARLREIARQTRTARREEGTEGAAEGGGGASSSAAAAAPQRPQPTPRRGSASGTAEAARPNELRMLRSSVPERLPSPSGELWNDSGKEKSPRRSSAESSFPKKVQTMPSLPTTSMSSGRASPRNAKGIRNLPPVSQVSAEPLEQSGNLLMGGGGRMALFGSSKPKANKT